MRTRGQFFRSRVGIALVGAIFIGGAGAVLGASSVWRPTLPAAGAAVQSTTTPEAGTTTVNANATSTSGPMATDTPQSMPTAVPTVASTATPFVIVAGSIIRGTVVSTNPGANSFVMSRLGTHYTILVDQATTYSGAAAQLSGIQPNWRVTVTVGVVEGTAYLAGHVASALPDN